MINAINLTNVKVFGEMEFWFAIIKVIAVVAMIIFGARLLFSGNGGPQASVSNLWDQGGFLPHGFTGLVMMMAIIMFSSAVWNWWGSPQQKLITRSKVSQKQLTGYLPHPDFLYWLVSRSALTNAVDPRYRRYQSVCADLPRVRRYLCSECAEYRGTDRCALRVQQLRILQHRMLFGLAQQGNAPKALASVDKRGVPVNTILVSALVTALCVLINYLAPESAFGLLMALVVSALVINWAMISLAHMKFRRAKQEQGVVTRFPALLYPLGNWICLLFMAAVLVIMLMTREWRFRYT